LNELYPNENVTFLILTLVMPNGFEIVYRWSLRHYSHKLKKNHA
jgi:hypothetical protein